MPRNRSGANGQSGDVLSTKEAAGICKVALSTIVYWFDKGLIRGYRTPGGHRRIFRGDLEKFMKEHAIPMGHQLDDDKLRVLLVGGDPVLADTFDKTLKSLNGRVEWTRAAEGFEAGRLVATYKPNLLLLDPQGAGVDGERICRQLKSDPETASIQVVVIAGPQSHKDDGILRDAGARQVLVKPVSREQIQSVVNALLTS
ncbi:MAG: response regulator [bacterium]